MTEGNIYEHYVHEGCSVSSKLDNQMLQWFGKAFSTHICDSKLAGSCRQSTCTYTLDVLIHTDDVGCVFTHEERICVSGFCM